MVTDNFVVVGSVGKPYGVRGWLKINSYTFPIENILDYQPWQIKFQGQHKVVEFDDSRIQGKDIIVHFSDCHTPEAAKLYTGLEIVINRTQLPDLAEGEYYWSDLQNLTVITISGVTLGKVDYIFSAGSNDVLVVKGDRERLVPYIMNEVIKQVDMKKGIIKVNWDPDF